MSAPLYRSVMEELPQLINDNDLHISQLVLTLLCTVMDVSPNSIVEVWIYVSLCNLVNLSGYSSASQDTYPCLISFFFYNFCSYTVTSSIESPSRLSPHTSPPFNSPHLSPHTSPPYYSPHLSPYTSLPSTPHSGAVVLCSQCPPAGALLSAARQCPDCLPPVLQQAGHSWALRAGLP